MEITNFTIKEAGEVSKFLQANNMADITAVDRLRFVTEGRQNFSFIAKEKTTEGEEKIVGSIIAISDGFRGYLNKLVVEPEFRQQGLGKQLVNKAVESLKLAGCQEIIILCKPFLAKWYESMGFVKDNDSLIYKLELGNKEGTECST